MYRTFSKANDLRKYLFKKYVYTINHKRIAINYFYFSMWTGLSGALLATMIRLEMAYPGSPFFKGDSIRYLQVLSAHGLIMVFFVVVPLLFGAFANFLIPYHVGSKDVAFPRLNSIGFWIQPLAFVLIAKVAFLRSQYWHYYDKTSFFLPILEKTKKRSLFQYLSENISLNSNPFFTDASFFFHTWRSRKSSKFDDYSVFSFSPLKLTFMESVIALPESLWYLADKVSSSRRRKVYFTKCSNRALTTSGWTFITPLSSQTKYTGVGAQDVLLFSVVLAGISTTISFTNLLITRRTLVAPGLRNRRVLIPFVTIAILLTLRMLAIVTPILGAAVIMVLLDRHWQTAFFDFTYGGDPILFQHLFWFFGHPEVYILIIPTFGITNVIIPHATTRRLSSKHHMVWAIYVMAYMGYVVWGHHMYLVGLDHRSRNMYSTITIMISLPATIKVVNWTLTFSNSAVRIDTPFIFTIAYIFFFLVGGFTGMWLSHVGLNISMHDTFYVVAHFHLMLAGVTVTGIFAGTYYYYYQIFGLKYNRNLSYAHFIYYVCGIWVTFIPIFYLGFAGLPRRIHDFPAIFLGWQGMATCGHFLTMIGVAFFFLNVFVSRLERKSYLSYSLGITRWQKRIHYYLYKIKWNQYNDNIAKVLPDAEERVFIKNNYFSEYEIFTKKI
jgi:heme/copper-type cytochrome/quinol oxidase subunit 1